MNTLPAVALTLDPPRMLINVRMLIGDLSQMSVPRPATPTERHEMDKGL